MKYPCWMLFREVLAEIWMRVRHPWTYGDYRVGADCISGSVWIERYDSCTPTQRALLRWAREKRHG